MGNLFLLKNTLRNRLIFKVNRAYLQVKGIVIVWVLLCLALQLQAQSGIPDSILSRAANLTVEERISYYNKKIFDYARNNPEAAQLLIDSVSKLMKSHSNPGDQVYFLRAVGEYQQAQKNYDSAMYYYRLAQKLKLSEGDKETELRLLIDFGNIHNKKGTVDSAMHYYQMADSLAGIYNKLFIKSIALLNIGGIYQNYKIDDTKALHYLEEAFQLINHMSKLNKITLYQSLGIAYRKTSRDSLALEMAQNSYDLAIDEGLLGDAAAATNSMALIYQENEQYQKALEAFEKARDIAVELNIIKGIILTNGNLSQIYYETGRYKKGLDLLKHTLSISFEHQFIAIRINIYEDMIRFYKKLGDFEKALKASESLNALQDSLANTETVKKITELEAGYQLHIKEEIIARQQAQLKHNRMLIGSLVSGGIIVVVSLIIISRLFFLKNKSLKKLVVAHKTLTNKNTQITKFIPCQQLSENRDECNCIYKKIYTYLITDQNYLKQTTTLDHAAEDTGINREYIRSAIKTTEACSFTSFINHHRIDHAKKLIMEDFFGNHSIEEIAQKSGFSSRTSFYRTFKEITGFTPAYYKSQLQEHAEGNI